MLEARANLYTSLYRTCLVRRLKKSESQKHRKNGDDIPCNGVSCFGGRFCFSPSYCLSPTDPRRFKVMPLHEIIPTPCGGTRVGSSSLFHGIGVWVPMRLHPFAPCCPYLDAVPRRGGPVAGLHRGRFCQDAGLGLEMIAGMARRSANQPACACRGLQYMVSVFVVDEEPCVLRSFYRAAHALME